MLIRTIQWNIGGARIRNEKDDPTDEVAYRHESLDYIATTLKPYNTDIICLQETHANDVRVQAKDLAADLGLDYFINDIYDHSHIDDQFELGQAIISRWPITNHTFELFDNPQLEVIRPNGEHWISHNKGVSSVQIMIENQLFCLKTAHLVPFRKFNRNPLAPEFDQFRQDMEKKLHSDEKITLLHGDFNWDGASLQDFLPGLFNQGLREVILDMPTTPAGRKYDRVLYQGLHHLKSKVLNDALTDHYPIYSEFEFR